MSIQLRYFQSLSWAALIGALVAGCQGGAGASGASGAAAAAAGSPAQQPAGMATVSWTPPTADVNGAMHVAGFRIYYGATTRALDHVVDVQNAEAVGYEVTGLAPGAWYFAVADYNADLVESGLSAMVEVTI